MRSATCSACKGDVIVSNRTRQRHSKYHDTTSPTGDGKQPDTWDNESMVSAFRIFWPFMVHLLLSTPLFSASFSLGILNNN